jgi:hypothetical protein
VHQNEHIDGPHWVQGAVADSLIYAHKHVHNISLVGHVLDEVKPAGLDTDAIIKDNTDSTGKRECTLSVRVVCVGHICCVTCLRPKRHVGAFLVGNIHVMYIVMGNNR